MPERNAGLDLTVEGLVLRGIGGQVLLDLPHLNLAAGRSMAVTGPSGAGKSSLLHALAGLVRPDAGRVVWGGTDIARLSEEGRARFRRERLGLVFQDFLLFDELDAVGNAGLAASFAEPTKRASLLENARAWLDRLGLGKAGSRRIDSFSGGERQRVAVARALAADASVILADEPTASLDRVNADQMIEDLAALAQDPGRTLIVVTHDEDLAERMGRILTMADGRIAGDSDG